VNHSLIDKSEIKSRWNILVYYLKLLGVFAADMPVIYELFESEIQFEVMRFL